jgi:hypothetical protein
MAPRFWVYLASVVFGLAVLAWPEQNSRMLVTLSERHGPSALDLLGLAFMLAGYAPMAAGVWTRRTQLQYRLGASWPWVIALVGVSWVGIVAGLATDREFVLWTSVTASTVAQSLLIVPAFARTRAGG